MTLTEWIATILMALLIISLLSSYGVMAYYKNATLPGNTEQPLTIALGWVIIFIVWATLLTYGAWVIWADLSVQDTDETMLKSLMIPLALLFFSAIWYAVVFSHYRQAKAGSKQARGIGSLADTVVPLTSETTRPHRARSG